jgi:hypothetical protein
MDLIWKVLLVLISLAIYSWTNIYGLYKPMKGDDKLSLGKLVCMIPFFIMVGVMEILTLLIIMWL